VPPARPGRDMARGGVQGKNHACMDGARCKLLLLMLGECTVAAPAAHTWRRVHAPAGRPRRAVAFHSCDRAVEVERSAARHERLTDRLARAAVSSGCSVGCRSRPAVSPRAPRVGTENLGGRGPSSAPGPRRRCRPGARGDGGRARQAFRRAAESTGTCMFRARPGSKRACPLPGLGATWHGVVSKARIMHAWTECAASCR
jgi:hypothetical protein